MAKRKEVEEKIFNTFNILDPSGKNTAKYKALFKSMSDKDFIDFFKKMKNDDNKNFYLEIELYGDNALKMAAIQKAANYLKVPLEEYVYTKHKSANGESIRSAFKVPVMFIHLKRMQQILTKKVRLNTNVAGPGVRSKITGSISNSSKTGRMSDADTIALMSIASIQTNIIDGEQVGKGSYILREILGARADNTEAKMQMQNDISIFGKSDIVNYSSKMLSDSQAINTLDVYLISAGLKSDVITSSDTLLTKQGLE